MKRHSEQIILLTASLVILALALFWIPANAAAQPKESPADPDAVWTKTCRDSIERTIQSDRSGTERVEIFSNSIREWQQSDDEKGVWGTGQIHQSGKRETYVFRCVYDFRQGRMVSVDYSFQDVTSGIDPLKPKEPAELGTAWTAACQHSIHTKIREAHPKAQTVQIDTTTMMQWQETENAIGMSGGGEYVGRKDGTHRFIYRCIYDANMFKLSKSTWQIRE